MDRMERPREDETETSLEKRISHAKESEPTSIQSAMRKEDLGWDSER